MRQTFVFLLAVLLSVTAFGQKPGPYGFQKKSLPVGESFKDILPKKVGPFTRIEFKEPRPGMDGEALYRNGKEEIFMLFSLAVDAKDQSETMQTIFVETEKDAVGELRDVSLKTKPAYIHLLGKGIAFFAWTRGLYCFSADSQKGNVIALKTFVDNFPF
jgi:hypothetical protein